MRVGVVGVTLLAVNACLLVCTACGETPERGVGAKPADQRVRTPRPKPFAEPDSVAIPVPEAAPDGASPQKAATVSDRLAAARAEFATASTPAGRVTAVAEIAAAQDVQRFEALLDIASGVHEPAVREAAVLAMGTPAAEPQAERLRALLPRLREPELRLAATLALMRIANRPLEQPEAFGLSASFEPAPAGAPVLRVRATVRATEAGGPVRAQVGLIGTGRLAGPTDRWVAPLDINEDRDLVVDLELSGAGPHTVELTASGEDTDGTRQASSRRWRVAFRDGVLEVRPEEDEGGAPPRERLR